MCNYGCSPLPFCQKPKISVLLVSLLLRLGWRGRGFCCKRGNRRCSTCRRWEVTCTGRGILLSRASSWSVSHLSSLGWASLPGLGSPGLRGRSPFLPLPLHSFLRAHPQSFSLSFLLWSPISTSSPGLCQAGPDLLVLEVWVWESCGGCGEVGGQSPCLVPDWCKQGSWTSHQHSNLSSCSRLGEDFLTLFGPFPPSSLLSLAQWWVAICPTCLSNTPWQAESCGTLGGTGRWGQSCIISPGAEALFSVFQHVI